MNKPVAWRRSISLHSDPVGGMWRADPLPETLRERSVIRGCGEEGSGKGCLRRGPVGEPGWGPGGGAFAGNFDS